jgi:primase-polymerase (primpol)-like protein
VGTVPAAFKGSTIEMYSKGRYVCLTGKSFQPFEPTEHQTEIDTLYSWLVAQRQKGKPEQKELPQVDYSCSLSASEIIDRASRSKGGDVFSQLYAGNWQGLNIGDNTQSAADLSFANRLYFWTGGDSALMTEIFKNSGMFRNERKTRLAISKALADGGEVYHGNERKNPIFHCVKRFLTMSRAKLDF